MIPKNTLKLFDDMVKVLKPPVSLKVSDWANQYRKLSSESSSEAGQWRNDRAPYQIEIMNAISDPETEKIVVKASAQVGKTEILLNTIGYYSHYDPSPIMYLVPTKELAESISKDRIEPMIRDTKELKEVFYTAKEKTKDNTILHKKFTGGHLTLVGSNAPTGLSSRPIRILLADEVDRFPMSAKKEGDPLNLAEKRTITFWNRKIIIVSTPTIKETSRIEKEYNESSMEEYYLKCPECGEYVLVEWKNIKFNKHDDETFELEGMVCTSCGVISEEYKWKNSEGKWIAKHPERRDRRGFHLNELVSPWRKWEDIVADFLKAKKTNETLKVWVNTSLGECWEEKGEIDSGEILKNRRQYYNCEIPQKVLCLTAAVDVQDNRLEYEIVGWGLDYESWGIKYGQIMGDPGQKNVWVELDKILAKNYTREDGQILQILTTCIDSGGHNTDEVYKYCKIREFQRVWAIKGQGGLGIPLIKRPKRRNDSGIWLFMLGVDAGKDIVMSRLKQEIEGPGYCHFPNELEKGYDEQYFEGLTSEIRVTRYTKGKLSIYWEKKNANVRNEPFDLRNYNTAAINILNPDFNLLYQQLNEKKEITKNENSMNVLKRKKNIGNVSKGIDI